MNKLVIAVILILVVGGGFMLFGKSQNSNTPTTEGPTQNTGTTIMPDQESSESAMEEGAVKEFTIESKGLNFTPNEIKVSVGDKVKVTYKNTMGKHDWTLDEFNAKTQLLDAGQEETVEFVADKAGSFEFYCSVAGHRAAGMKGTLIVE
ncbi:MAG: cupredoxin domain-containing protein [Patescibacteria group bacterium]